MSESSKLSRRDWFRLRIPRKNQMLEEESSRQTKNDGATVSANGLKPIEHPPNHDGMDLSKLPPMREATLSNEEVIALFDDIQQFGTDVLLMQRATGAQRADASKVDSANQLEIAKAALLSSAIARLQIRYRWQGQQWIDTLKRNDEGYHIVRIAHQTR